MNKSKNYRGLPIFLLDQFINLSLVRHGIFIHFC